MSTRHLDDNERTSLALELMSFKIKYFYLSKAQIVLRIEGVDVEVLRSLLHCSTTYLPFGQRQQPSQVVLGQVKPMHNNWYCMNVYYSPVGSMPLFPLQIARSKVASYVDSADDIAGTELGYSLTKDYPASRFEFRTVIDDNNSYTSMITFWAPRSVNFSFPRDLLSTAVIYYHTQERRESHRNMKPRKNTGAELAKSATLAIRTDSLLSRQLAARALHRKGDSDY